MLKENKKLININQNEEVGFGENTWKILKWDLLNIKTVQNL